jgi:hypothetical protein
MPDPSPHQPNLSTHPLVTKLRGDSDTPPSLVALIGYFGPSKKADSIRLYPSLDFQSYFEIPTAAIVATTPVDADDEDSPTVVHVKAGTPVDSVQTSTQPVESYLQGGITGAHPLIDGSQPLPWVRVQPTPTATFVPWCRITRSPIECPPQITRSPIECPPHNTVDTVCTQIHTVCACAHPDAADQVQGQFRNYPVSYLPEFCGRSIILPCYQVAAQAAAPAPVTFNLACHTHNIVCRPTPVPHCHVSVNVC